MLSTKRSKLLIQRLETRYIYNIPRKTLCPEGMYTCTASVTEALREAENIFYTLCIKYDTFANIRFYICKPQEGTSSYYEWDNNAVHNLCGLVKSTMQNFGIWKGTEGLQVVVNCYRSGDTQDFLSECKAGAFGGIVLMNRNPQSGLKLVRGNEEYMLNESTPISWLLMGSDRSSWQQGYAAPDGANRDIVRISI